VRIDHDSNEETRLYYVSEDDVFEYPVFHVDNLFVGENLKS